MEFEMKGKKYRFTVTEEGLTSEVMDEQGKWSKLKAFPVKNVEIKEITEKHDVVTVAFRREGSERTEHLFGYPMPDGSIIWEVD